MGEQKVSFNKHSWNEYKNQEIQRNQKASQKDKEIKLKLKSLNKLQRKAKFKSMAKQEEQKPETYQGETRGAGRSKYEK